MRRREISAGILAFRRKPALEVLLAHPGGPFWAKKDDGVWTIPKGLVEPGDDLVATARREFTEETNLTAEGKLVALTPVNQKSGKVVHAFAVEADSSSAHSQAIRSRSSGRRNPAGGKVSGDRPHRLFRAAGRQNKDYRLSAAAIARARSARRLKSLPQHLRPVHLVCGSTQGSRRAAYHSRQAGSAITASI